MKPLLAFTALAALTLALPAHADTFDVNKATCQDLTKAAGDEGDASGFFVWVHGYLAGKAGNSTLDIDAVTEAIQKATDYCEQHPNETVVAALSQPK
jgi:acid stress chaperone HdeB